MNILKTYSDNVITSEYITAKKNELKTIGNFSDFFVDKFLCISLNDHFYNNYEYMKDLLYLLKNNKDFAGLVKNITINSIIADNDNTSISFNINKNIFKINFKNKTINNYKNKNFIYGDDYIIKLDESKNISKPINNGSNPQKEKSNIIIPIKKIESIEKYIDMTDPTSKAIISTFWSNDNVKLFKSKIHSIISKIPKIYREEFKLNKFYIKNGTKANINDFTLIGKTGKKLHCIFNPTNNKFSCSIT